jgi:pimeloyl-ACP methyl ester carboxylesterase
MLLIHSINASGSAAEMRPLHEHYRSSRTVVAVDLPGFGFSERSDRNYTPRLMTDAVHAITDQIRARLGASAIDALALSLSCEFLARAAVERPDRYRSLALVSPTGFSGLRPWRGAPGSTRGLPWLYRALRGPGGIWGGALFRALTRPGVIHYFLRRTWGSAEIDEALWAYDLLTTKAPGAEHAPLHFIAANLFSADIHEVYEKLDRPVWMSHGVRGDFTDYRSRVIVEARPNWRFTVFPTGALPFFEKPEDFTDAWNGFLAAVPT